MNTNIRQRCKGTSGQFGMNTNPPRPCSLYAKSGSDYCIYHTPDYESPRSKQAAEKWRKEGEQKQLHDKLHRILISAIKEIAGGHNNARGIALELVRNWSL